MQPLARTISVSASESLTPLAAKISAPVFKQSAVGSEISCVRLHEVQTGLPMSFVSIDSRHTWINLQLSIQQWCPPGGRAENGSFAHFHLLPSSQPHAAL